MEVSEINTDCIFQDCRAGSPPRAQVLTDQEGLSIFQMVHFLLTWAFKTVPLFQTLWFTFLKVPIGDIRY